MCLLILLPVSHDGMIRWGQMVTVNKQVEVVIHKLIWELCSIYTGHDHQNLSQAAFILSSYTNLYDLKLQCVWMLCVDACDCLCTSGSVIGFYLHCNCLGSSSMSFWQYVKHNKTLGLNFLTSDLDLHFFFIYKYCDISFFFYMEIRKHFHMSELQANYTAHISYQSCSFL